MTALERLADLRANLDHLASILAGRELAVEELRQDRSLRNDVLFSLLMICQGVIDVAGEIAGRHGLRFQDYTEAVRALEQVEGFSTELVRRLEPLPGFRNVLIHEYVALDVEHVAAALRELESIREFVRLAAAEIERLEG